MLFVHQNNQFEAKTVRLVDFSILTKIAVSRPYRRGHFVGWFFWVSFSNVENTLRILLKHSKFCSSIKTISLKEKQHVLPTFRFWPKSLYPDLTGVAILLVDFFGWVFQMLKIPFEFFWNIQNFVLPSKQSVWRKNNMFCGLFNFDQNRWIRNLPAWPFFWLIFWNVENTLRILLKHSKFCSFIKKKSLKQKQLVLRAFQFWRKSLYPDLTGVAIIVGWFFRLSFSNVENTLRILLKHSKFCSFIKTISLMQKQHVLRTFQFWPKSLYPDLTGVAFFLVHFLKCCKDPSNSSETFKMLFFHQNNQFEAKTTCFADFSILTKIAVSGPYRHGHFFGCFFQMLKIPFEFFWNIQNVVRTSKQSVWCKNSMFSGLFNFDQNRCIQTLPGWPFCWLIFLVEFFKCWKYPSNSSETFKMLFVHQNNQFDAKTVCLADFSILTKIAVSRPYRGGHFFGWFFLLSFSNVENTLRILLKHSKFCSSIKTISLKQKQHVLRNFQFWPKSLYPDLTGVAIFWLIFWNVENTLRILLKHSKFFLSSKQ